MAQVIKLDEIVQVELLFTFYIVCNIMNGSNIGIENRKSILY